MPRRNESFDLDRDPVLLIGGSAVLDGSGSRQVIVPWEEVWAYLPGGQAQASRVEPDAVKQILLEGKRQPDFHSYTRGIFMIARSAGLGIYGYEAWVRRETVSGTQHAISVQSFSGSGYRMIPFDVAWDIDLFNSGAVDINDALQMELTCQPVNTAVSTITMFVALLPGSISAELTDLGRVLSRGRAYATGAR